MKDIWIRKRQNAPKTRSFIDTIHWFVQLQITKTTTNTALFCRMMPHLQKYVTPAENVKRSELRKMQWIGDTFGVSCEEELTLTNFHPTCEECLAAFEKHWAE